MITISIMIEMGSSRTPMSMCSLSVRLSQRTFTARNFWKEPSAAFSSTKKYLYAVTSERTHMTNRPLVPAMPETMGLNLFPNRPTTTNINRGISRIQMV